MEPKAGTEDSACGAESTDGEVAVLLPRVPTVPSRSLTPIVDLRLSWWRKINPARLDCQQVFCLSTDALRARVGRRTRRASTRESRDAVRAMRDGRSMRLAFDLFGVLVRREQFVHLRRAARLELEDPAIAERVLVDRLGLVGQRIVDLQDRA